MLVATPATAPHAVAGLARPVQRPHHASRAPYVIIEKRVRGHVVRIVRWHPGGRTHAFVAWARTRRTVPEWAHARHPGHNVAAVNGSTWTWRTGRPSGTVISRGHRVTPVSDQPAVGFDRRGGVMFGARNAVRHRAANVVAGTAYLIRNGVIQTRFPYANYGQRTCGPRGTDGYGCWRGNVVRFRHGEVGLVEITYASMPEAARVLHALHVVDALTLDSGGSSNLWTVRGHHGTCVDPQVVGHCFGITHASGLHWERPVDDAIVVEVR
jgi:Phosphodiester glycosidase